MNSFNKGNDMTLLEWFNPQNIEHLKAYVALSKTGHWPENFLPPNIEIPAMWHVSLLNKIAEQWIKYKLAIKCRCGEKATHKASFESDRNLKFPMTFYCRQCLEDMTDCNGNPREIEEIEN